MIVRELITLLGFTVDKASYDKASKAYDSLQGKLAKPSAAQAQQVGVGKVVAQAQQAAKGVNAFNDALGMAQRFAAQFGVSHILASFTELASAADETQNVIKQLFGDEGLKQTIEWSEKAGAAMGRSKYSLQQYASTLGAVLQPIAKSDAEAQQMAQTFAGLAVDMGSFFNTSDEDAMRALRSGLTGEYESLKRYGIVLNDALLTEIAHERGIHKKVTAMSAAEKTELRYAAIMQRTERVQGDAERTSEGFANASKALKESLKDLGTDMAHAVLPKVERMIFLARDALKAFNKMAKGTNVLEAAMWTLAAVAAVLAIEFYGAFVAPAIAILGIILLVDELITLFRGGKTVIGDFVDSMFGDGTAQEWVANMIAGFTVLKEVFGDLVKAWSDAGGWAGVMKTWETIGIWFGDWAARIADAITWPFRKVRELLEKLGVKFDGPGLQEQSYERATGRGIGAGTVGSLGELAQRREQERRAAKAAAAPATAGAPATTGAPATVSAPGAAAGAAGAPPQVTVEVGQPIININGGNEDRVRRVVEQALAAKRKTHAAAAGGRGRS